mmetsp:Transcript_16982/g.33380  ORF Transcript_16982/g.33380 Transcript_16982/m.33380 type:complete len:130 (-) Transcript_16982:371-760(-)
MVSYFFEKPELSLVSSFGFLTFRKKKLISSILKVCQKKIKKKRSRWSIFSKLFLFYFHEVEFFFTNCISKKNIHYFIDHSRQLIDNFFFSNYLPKTNRYLIGEKEILWRCILPIFFNLPNTFFFGWSFC